MKYILAMIAALLLIFLAGCVMGNVVDVTVALKNLTDHELELVIFDIPQSSGTYSPWNEVIPAGGGPLKPREERVVVISFVDSDFGNRGGALIRIKDDGGPDALKPARGEVVLWRGTNRFTITRDAGKFVITKDGSER
jgi:hypothetical protein